jgi:hypothetical protein
MKISKAFKLGRDQSTVDFVDIDIAKDAPIFIDPLLIKGLNTPWGNECSHHLTTFFAHVLDLAKRQKGSEAEKILSKLRERNEFHFGFSRKKSAGRGLGKKQSTKLWNALLRSKAVKSGLLKDLEDSCLLIEGIGPDLISDAISNILKGPLIKYTQDMCRYYGIPMKPHIASGPIWNPSSKAWEEKHLELPLVGNELFLLIPKWIVRFDFSISADDYFRHYLLPQLQNEEISLNSGLVKLLKDGRKRVTKKSLIEKYGSNKPVISDLSIKRAFVLDDYKSAKQEHLMPANHDDWAANKLCSLPKWNDLLENVLKIPAGITHASKYESELEKLLTALFFPSLQYPKAQQRIHEGRKRIDLSFTNVAQSGFFNWLSANYSAPLVHFEFKNYDKDISNPEIDQLCGRFGPSRGQVGFLFCRKLKDKKLFLKRCRDSVADGRGYVIAVDDKDLSTLVDRVSKDGDSYGYDLLRERFMELVL